MPPKSQITQEMIIEAGFQLIRREGAAALNVRRIAEELHCSTQPVMYRFSTVEELTAQIHSVADSYHSEYLMTAECATDDPMLAIGLRYIRFAAEESNLFRFLFQSDKYAGFDLGQLVGAEELAPVFEVLQQEAGITAEQSRAAFEALFLTVHGIASLLANNSMEYDEGHFADVLKNVFMGVIGMMKGGNV